MKLNSDDLKAIGSVVDEKLEKKLEEKLKPVYDFTEFAKTAILELLDENEERSKQKLPERVKKLEEIHPAGNHSS